MAPAEPKVKKPKAPDVVSRQMTMHLARRVKNITFKKKAPRAIREIKKFAVREMKTSDVRIDTKLNEHIFAMGVRSMPTRIRLVLERRRNKDEEAKEKMYTHVKYVPCTNFKELNTETVEED